MTGVVAAIAGPMIAFGTTVLFFYVCPSHTLWTQSLFITSFLIHTSRRREIRLAQYATVSIGLKYSYVRRSPPSSPPPLAEACDSEQETGTGQLVTIFNKRHSYSSSSNEKWTSTTTINALENVWNAFIDSSGHVVKIKFLRPYSSADAGTYVPFLQVECHEQIEPCSFDILDSDFSVVTKAKSVFDRISLEDDGNWSEADERMRDIVVIDGLNGKWVERTTCMW